MVEDGQIELLNLFKLIWENSNVQMGISTAVVTSVASVIVSGTVFFIKRYLSNKDFVNQQNIEHSTWLLEKLHDFAEKYYVLLTRNLINAEDDIKNADLSQNSLLTESAYDRVVKLVKNYDKFQEESGANILFIERKKQNDAIGKLQSLWFSLPFDPEDYRNIVKDQHTRAKQSFFNWIDSKNCPKSKAMVKQRLFELRSMFDDQSEKILHHEYFLKSRKRRDLKQIKMLPKRFARIFSKKKMIDPFYIHKIVPKYVEKGKSALVFGKGFSSPNITYSLKINSKELQLIKKDDTLVEITIPSDLTEGTYEITADFSINSKKDDESMGMVIHIICNQAQTTQ